MDDAFSVCQQGRRWRDRLVARFNAKSVGSVFVATGYVLISGISVVHFTKLLPLTLASSSGVPGRLLHYGWSIFLLVELFLLYSLAIYTNPGYVELNAFEILDDNNDNGEPAVFCHKCVQPKPHRSHHCRMCRRCVYEMDHHCPWINNCVGYGNYRHFWLLLMYLWISCGYVSIQSAGPFIEAFQDRKYHRDFDELLHRFAVVFAFLSTSILCVVLFCYWGWHLYLVLTQQTTIEFMLRSQNKPRSFSYKETSKHYLQRDWKRKLQRLLGRKDKFWLLAFVIPSNLLHSIPTYVAKRNNIVRTA